MLYDLYSDASFYKRINMLMIFKCQRCLELQQSEKVATSNPLHANINRRKPYKVTSRGVVTVLLSTFRLSPRHIDSD